MDYARALEQLKPESEEYKWDQEYMSLLRSTYCDQRDLMHAELERMLELPGASLYRQFLNKRAVLEDLADKGETAPLIQYLQEQMEWDIYCLQEMDTLVDGEGQKVEQERRDPKMSTEELEERLEAFEEFVDYTGALKVVIRDCIKESEKSLKKLREARWSPSNYYKRFLGDSNTGKGCNFKRDNNGGKNLLLT